jgi:hypothetical protein
MTHEWRLYGGIASRQQTTSAVITSHEPAQHNRYGYAFTLAGRTYHGGDSPADGNWSMGQRVTVYYDRAAPETNALTDYRKLQHDAIRPLALILGGSAFTILLTAFLRRRPAREALRT